MKHQQLKFDLQPTSQRTIVEIQKSKYPDKKSQYEFYRLYRATNIDSYGHEVLHKEIKRLEKLHPGYRWRVKKLIYQTFTQEILAKVEYLK